MSPVVLAVGVLIFVSGFTFGLTLGLVIRKLPREVAVQVRDIRTWSQKRQASLVGVFLILMALLTYQSQRESGTAVDAVDAQAACVATYANRLYESLTPRQHAFERLQKADQRFKKVDQTFAAALAKLLVDSMRAHPDSATTTRDAHQLKRATIAKRVALEHANAVSDRLARKRAANPYPLPPKQVCPK